MANVTDPTQWSTEGYYVCAYGSRKVLRGPYTYRSRAAGWIHDLPKDEQVKYCTCSRYELWKDYIYVRSKKGDHKLRVDLQLAGYYPPQFCGNDGAYIAYIDRWQENFGDDVEGEWHYMELGKKRAARVKKLDLETYNTYTHELEKAREAFGRADRHHDEEAIGRALAWSTQFEIALLI